jgi:glycosyltransferase involved in cell wall biosynthesis
VKNPRVFIYNNHWSTFGGGEIYLLQLAKITQRMGLDTALIGESFPSDFHRRIGTYFNIHLNKIKLLRGKPNDFDLDQSDIFVNGSFGSTLPSPTLRGIYICHFPYSKYPTVITKRKPASNVFVSSRNETIYPQSAKTMYVWDAGRLHLSSGGASIKCLSRNLTVTSGHESLQLARGEIGTLSPNDYNLIADNEVSAEINFELSSNASRSILLGIANSRFRSFIDSYSQVWSDSEYTAFWMQELWRKKSLVMYPPVSTADDPVGSTITNQGIQFDKEYAILSIGRFMKPSSSHPKRQDALIEAFSNLVKKDNRAWTLHLIGGVDKRSAHFLKTLRKRSDGLDIFFYPNLQRELLNSIKRNCTYYWHATGIKSTKPIQAEHFGIAVVEGLMSGLIPLVYNMGGPAEILADFPELRFNDTNDLVRKTIAIAGSSNTTLLETLSGVAKKFHVDAFEISVQTALANISVDQG